MPCHDLLFQQSKSVLSHLIPCNHLAYIEFMNVIENSFNQTEDLRDKINSQISEPTNRRNKGAFFIMQMGNHFWISSTHK